MRALRWILCVGLTLGGCSDDASDSTDNTPVCIPAVAYPCFCATGAAGEKICTDDGLEYGTCACLPDAGEIDAGEIDAGEIDATVDAEIDGR